MDAFVKRVETFWERSSPSLPALLESLIYAAFLSSLALSFFSLLNAPLLYLAVFVALAAAIYRRLSEKTEAPEAQNLSRAERWIFAAIVGFLLVQAFFTPPVSSDGQRIKLVRILLGVESGSAWDTSRVDGAFSTMYNFPSPYYLIFTPVEALHLPLFAYSLINVLLLLGSLATLAGLLRARFPAALFFVLLFLAAPQFIFAALSEHEDMLSFFLCARAAWWLMKKELDAKAVFFGVACSLLAIGVKYTAAIFLPFALLSLAFCAEGKERFFLWARPKTVLTALVCAAPLGALILLPDMMVSLNRGHGIFDQIFTLAGTHASSVSGCFLPQFGLRLFEFLFDPLNILLDFAHLNLSGLLPAYAMLPAACSPDAPTLVRYLAADSISRTGTYFGFLPWVALFALGLRGARREMRAAFALWLAPVLAYCFSFTYWSGTGRYFMAAFLILLPPFAAALDAARKKSGAAYHRLLAFLLLPFACVALWSETGVNNIPRIALRGDYFSASAARLEPALREARGKTNIYFNDVMSFYALMRAIPSQDVWLKKTLMEGATNLVGVPVEYSGETNLHEENWMFPVPAKGGAYRYVNHVGAFFANRVPAAFFMSGKTDGAAPGFNLAYYAPAQDLKTWAAALGGDYRFRVSPENAGGVTQYFLSDRRQPQAQGLCIAKNRGGIVLWRLAQEAECQ